MEQPFPIAEVFTVAALRQIEGHGAGTSTPNNLESAGVFHRVSRGPGSDDGTTDAPLMDIETFASRRLAAAEAAEVARQVMLSLTGQSIGGVLIDRVTTASAPAWVDFKNPAVHRYVHSYRVELRR